jgi:MFS family permease
MLKMLQLPLSYVILLTIITKVSNILFITLWGRYSDKFSNKTILQFCAPIFLVSIFAWTFTTMPGQHILTLPLLVLIHIFIGIALSGVELALGNIGLKLAPQNDSLAYLSLKNMFQAIFGAIGPMIGGLFVDFFAKHTLSWNFVWNTPTGKTVIHLIELQQWDFFFVFAVILGLVALYHLRKVKESGEVHKKEIMQQIKTEVREMKIFRKKVQVTEPVLRIENAPSTMKNVGVARTEEIRKNKKLVA